MWLWLVSDSKLNTSTSLSLHQNPKYQELPEETICNFKHPEYVVLQVCHDYVFLCNAIPTQTLVIYSFVGNSLKFLTKPWRWHSNLPCQHQIDNKPSTNRPFSHDITLPLIFLNKEISLLWEISSFLMQTFSVVWEHQYGRHKNALLSISALENLALCDTSMWKTNWPASRNNRWQNTACSCSLMHNQIKTSSKKCPQ